MLTPCAHMIEREPPECEMGRKIPLDCHQACAHYDAGITEQERIRSIKWATIMNRSREHHDERG